MAGDDPKQTPTLDEVYALIDKNRAEAAKAAQAKFHSDMEAAIAAIANISSVAGARVLADSQVASAKILINAEVGASRLLAEAEMHASRVANEALTKPPEFVEKMLLEIGKETTLLLTASAKESVEAIQRDSENAIKVLRETGALAIGEIQAMATKVETQTRADAEKAAAKLTEYRKAAHTADEAALQGEEIAQIIITAAEDASAVLKEAVKTTVDKINTITEQACSNVRQAALAAEEKVIGGQERALARLKETLYAHRRH